MELKKQGRPKINPELKKDAISLKLPKWLLAKMAGESLNRAVMIEQALIEKYGWTPPSSDD